MALPSERAGLLRAARDSGVSEEGAQVRHG